MAQLVADVSRVPWFSITSQSGARHYNFEWIGPSQEMTLSLALSYILFFRFSSSVAVSEAAVTLIKEAWIVYDNALRIFYSFFPYQL